MTGHRTSIRGYVIDKKGRLVKRGQANLPRSVAIARSKSKRRYAPVPSFEVKK
jgi:hypothetical protein